MNEDPKNEGVVIDVTPEREDNPDTEPVAEKIESTPTEEKPKPSAAGPALTIAVIALILVTSGLTVAYYYWAGIKHDLETVDSQIAAALSHQTVLESRVDEANQAIEHQKQSLAAQQATLELQASTYNQQQESFQAQEQLLQEERLQMQEREAELRSAVADVHKRIGRSGTQWMVSEAEFLIRLAIHRLQLARDVITAQAALELADQRLSDTDNPAWTQVRQALADSIADLAAAEIPDTSGIAAKLTTLSNQVPKLQLKSAAVQINADTTNQTTTAASERSWDTLLSDLWQGLKNSVRIRRNDQPIQAMLSPEHQFFLFENLKLQLEAANLALVRGDQATYQSNLQKAQHWLQDLFDINQSNTGNMINTLEQLAAINIRPEMPDISHLLLALKAREKLMSDLATDNNTEAASQ